MATNFAPAAATYLSSAQPYVISASSFLGGFPAYSAFNSNTNYWLGQNSGVDWLQLYCGSGDQLSLASYSIRVNTIPEPTRAPKNWTMKASNDGSSWTTIDTQTNQTTWTSGETRSFTPSDTTTKYRYWRLDITANNGDSTYTDVMQLQLLTNDTQPTNFAPTTMSNNSTPSPYVTSANTDNTDAYRAFDGSKAGGNSWIGTAGGAGILEIDVSSATLLLGYTVFGSANAANRSPKDWTVQGSNDNSSWTTVDTESSQTSWGTSSVVEGRSFPCATATTAYRYFRINITANNGDGTNTDISEMYLWQGTVPPPAMGLANPLGGPVEPIGYIL